MKERDTRTHRHTQRERDREREREIERIDPAKDMRLVAVIKAGPRSAGLNLPFGKNAEIVLGRW